MHVVDAVVGNRGRRSDSGHLPPLRASTPHSSRTSPVRRAAQRNRRNTPTTGKATMLAAKTAQITVCESLIAVNIWTQAKIQRETERDGKNLVHDDQEVQTDLTRPTNGRERSRAKWPATVEGGGQTKKAMI